jgi:hypothetical protein
MRTYMLKAGSIATFEQRFAEALEVRKNYSPMVALWHTEIGPLNQMVHIWPYEDLKQREEIRAKAAADPSGKWPPKLSEFEVDQQSEILIPAPFMRPLTGEPQALGNIYELRTYTYQPGMIPKVLELWTEAVPHREKYSPLAGCWYSELGGLNRFFHLWPYKDMAERTRIRDESLKDPHWPAPTGQWIIRQENKILIPAACSPLH